MEGVVIDVKVFSRLEEGRDLEEENEDKIEYLKEGTTEAPNKPDGQKDGGATEPNLS